MIQTYVAHMSTRAQCAQHLLNIHFYFSLSLVVTSIYYRNSPLFCHDVEWNKLLPQAFFIGETVYFSHYHQPFRELPCWFSLIPLFFCLNPPPTLTYPPDCDFQTPLHVLFVCAFICSHSSLPPRLKAFCLLFMVSVTEATTRERDEKRKWEGEGSVFHVFVACEVRKELVLGTAWCAVLNEGLIYCFVCLLSGCSRCWLNRDGENICTSKAICVYYRLFMAVFLPTIVHTIYS